MSIIAKIFITIIFVAPLLWMTFSNPVAVEFSAPPVVDTIELPLPIIMLACVVVGFLWGASIVWLNGASARGEVRRQRREIKALEQEVSKKE